MSHADYAALVVAQSRRISISHLRADGQVSADATRVRITIDELSREVRVVHRRFSNNGDWAFFICPECGRRARVLRLYEKLACWRCVGLMSRCEQGTRFPASSALLRASTAGRRCFMTTRKK
jgi:hypothetical protein